MRTKKPIKGFTLLEIIIVIAVFSIGIMAVFYLVSNNLQRLDETKTRNLATFLAKEGIETIFNARDANLQKELPRNCVFTENYINNPNPEFCEGYFSSGINGKYIQIVFNPEEYPKLIRTNSNNFDDNKIYYHSGSSIFYYNNDPINGEETNFARYILFTGVAENGNILPINKILKIESHVVFSKGGKTGEVVLESLIGEY